MFFNLLVLFQLFYFSYAVTPIVIWHGMGDSCCSPISLGPFMEYLKQEIPGVYIHSLKIGNNTVEEVENGFFLNANIQIEEACKLVRGDARLKNGYNAIGFSQGGQFLRALAQRCPSGMKNLISLGGQHQGVYGLPHCLFAKHKGCGYLRSLLNYGAYWSWVQDQFVQAEYWHDPINIKEYVEGSYFLADINNERSMNEQYKKGLTSLNTFVMVKFLNDTMVEPMETEWFGFYKPGQGTVVNGLRESSIYTEPDDRLGLRQMDKEGKLKFLSVVGDHLQITTDWFTKEIINVYLK